MSGKFISTNFVMFSLPLFFESISRRVACYIKKRMKALIGKKCTEKQRKAIISPPVIEEGNAATHIRFDALGLQGALPQPSSTWTLHL